ncbi:unnamed protein product, partial [Meganyctiphanes norvegica]
MSTNRRRSLTGGKDLKVLQFLRGFTSSSDKEAKANRIADKNVFIIDKPPVATVAPMKPNQLFISTNENRSKSFNDLASTDIQNNSYQDVNTEENTMSSPGAGDSLVYLQESFPQYSPRYLNECLKHYKYNVEDVLDVLKKVSLPAAAFAETIHVRRPSLRKLPEQKVERKSAESYSTVFAECKQTTEKDSENVTLRKENNGNCADLQNGETEHPNLASKTEDSDNTSNTQQSYIHKSPRKYKIQTITYVKAIYNCNPDDEDELHFVIGDIVRIVDKPHDTWWMGEINGRRGLFPSNYVRDYKVEETAVPCSPSAIQEMHGASSSMTDEIDGASSSMFDEIDGASSGMTDEIDGASSSMTDNNCVDGTIKPQLPPKKHKYTTIQTDKSIPIVKDSASTLSEEGNSILPVNSKYNEELSEKCNSDSGTDEVDSLTNTSTCKSTVKCVTSLPPDLPKIESNLLMKENSIDFLPESRKPIYKGIVKRNSVIFEKPFDMISDKDIGASGDTMKSNTEGKKNQRSSRLETSKEVKWVKPSELQNKIKINDTCQKTTEPSPSPILKKNESSSDILNKPCEKLASVEKREWDTSEPQVIKLIKSDQGLGFTIISSEDPLNPHKIAIEIKTIKSGSVADNDGRLHPGDRLEAINGILVDNGTFDYAVATLKGVPKGLVSLCVRKQI